MNENRLGLNCMLEVFWYFEYHRIIYRKSVLTYIDKDSSPIATIQIKTRGNKYSLPKTVMQLVHRTALITPEKG